MTSRRPSESATTTVATPLSNATPGEFLSTGNAAKVLAQRTAEVDAAVIRAFEETLAVVYSSGLAALAVGGFGRRELFPYSDVDVLLLTDRDLSDPGDRTAISCFVQRLWDAGLRLSHSVHTVEECTTLHLQNIELNVSLLDMRPLVGDTQMVEGLGIRLPKFLRQEGRDLARHICRLALPRHDRFQNTVCQLEPDIKECPGGIRDLHLIHWLERLRAAVTLVPPPEEAVRFLHRLRCLLHYRAGRDSNHLSFEMQEEAAALAFFGARAPAAWMREYYSHALSIHRAAVAAMEQATDAGSNLLTQFRAWRSRLSNADFSVVREQVHLKNPLQLEADPELALRFYQFIARHGLKPAPESELRIARMASRVAPRWPHVVELLRQPHALAALRAMHASGVLKTWLPEWERIECLVVRDFHHRYTVDEHSLVAIGELIALRGASQPEKMRFRQLLEECEQPELLLFSLVFHDIGKAVSMADHIAESERFAAAALDRLGAPAEARRTALFLVRHHADLSLAMNTRDPADPATSEWLARRIETVENLRLLMLVSYADSSAVHPGAMTTWRMEQLWRLYVETYNELTRELDVERIGAVAEDAAEESSFQAGFPTRYLRTQPPEAINVHRALHDIAVRRGAAVELKKGDGAWQLVVAARDHAGLFAALCGAISSFGLNILKAEAFANRRGIVLDMFAFADPNRNLDLNPPEVERFRLLLERAALGKIDPTELLKRRPKPKLPSRGARVTPVVSFNQRASESATLVEITAQDRPGLLHDIAREISAAGCSIDVVLVDTEAHKALDVFYVTAGGCKLNDEKTSLLRSKLLQAIQ
jgi:[protein-PII] uridylyltransferase